MNIRFSDEVIHAVRDGSYCEKSCDGYNFKNFLDYLKSHNVNVKQLFNVLNSKYPNINLNKACLRVRHYHDLGLKVDSDNILFLMIINWDDDRVKRFVSLQEKGVNIGKFLNPDFFQGVLPYIPDFNIFDSLSNGEGVISDENCEILKNLLDIDINLLKQIIYLFGVINVEKIRFFFGIKGKLDDDTYNKLKLYLRDGGLLMKEINDLYSVSSKEIDIDSYEDIKLDVSKIKEYLGLNAVDLSIKMKDNYSTFGGEVSPSNDSLRRNGLKTQLDFSQQYLELIESCKILEVFVCHFSDVDVVPISRTVK